MSAQLTTNINTEKIFIGKNRYTTATYTNDTGDTVTLSAGRIMGRVLASNKVLPQDKDSSDGSQVPRFVLADDYTVANGASQTVSLCCGGDVVESKLSYASGETKATAISTLGTVEDLLRANSGIYIIATDDYSGYDNQ